MPCSFIIHNRRWFVHRGRLDNLPEGEAHGYASSHDYCVWVSVQLSLWTDRWIALLSCKNEAENFSLGMDRLVLGFYGYFGDSVEPSVGHDLCTHRSIQGMETGRKSVSKEKIGANQRLLSRRPKNLRCGSCS